MMYTFWSSYCEANPLLPRLFLSAEMQLATIEWIASTPFNEQYSKIVPITIDWPPLFVKCRGPPLSADQKEKASSVPFVYLDNQYLSQSPQANAHRNLRGNLRSFVDKWS